MDNKDMKELMCLLDESKLSICNNIIVHALDCVNMIRDYLNDYHKLQIESERFYEKQEKDDQRN